MYTSQEFPGCYAFMILLLQHKDKHSFAFQFPDSKNLHFSEVKTEPTPLNTEESQ